MTLEDWLTCHSYLQSVADFQIQVEAAVSVVPIPAPAICHWDDYKGDFLSGVPLLRSPRAAIDLQPAEEVITGVIHELASRASYYPPFKQMSLLRTIPACCATWAGLPCIVFSAPSSRFSPSGAMKSNGFVAIAQLVDRSPPWRSWSEWIPDGYAFSCAVAAALDGATAALGALSVRTKVIIDSRC
jgi:hypothetical protein